MARKTQTQKPAEAPAPAPQEQARESRVAPKQLPIGWYDGWIDDVEERFDATNRKTGTILKIRFNSVKYKANQERFYIHGVGDECYALEQFAERFGIDVHADAEDALDIPVRIHIDLPRDKKGNIRMKADGVTPDTRPRVVSLYPKTQRAAEEQTTE